MIIGLILIVIVASVVWLNQMLKEVDKMCEEEVKGHGKRNNVV